MFLACNILEGRSLAFQDACLRSTGTEHETLSRALDEKGRSGGSAFKRSPKPMSASEHTMLLYVRNGRRKTVIAHEPQLARAIVLAGVITLN